jgi:FMN phosphatase YigB (HAD superfamily)
MITAAFCEEDAEFSRTLARDLVTIPLVDRLTHLARYANVQLGEDCLNKLRKAFENAILNPLPELVSGADGFIAWVKAANVKLCLLANTGWFSCHAITRALTHHNLTRFFDFLVYSDEVGAAKPSAKIFDVAIAAADSRRDATVHIGDKLTTDIAGALNAGIDAVHFHPNGRCSSPGIWCASDYHEVRALLSTRLGLRVNDRHAV